MTQNLSGANVSYDTSKQTKEEEQAGRNSQLEAIGRKRLQKLIPKDTKACLRNLLTAK